MIHRASLGLDGNAEDFEKAKERLDQVDSILVESIKEKSGLSEEKIREYMENETTFTSKRALKEGLIDEILPPNKKFTEAMIDEAIKAYKEVSDTRKVNLNDRKEKTLMDKDNQFEEIVEDENEVKTEEQPKEVEAKVNKEPEIKMSDSASAKIQNLMNTNTFLTLRIQQLEEDEKKLEKKIKDFEAREKVRSRVENSKLIEEAVLRGALEPAKEQSYIDKFKLAEGNEMATDFLRETLRNLPSSDYFKVEGKAFSKEELAYYPPEEVERLINAGNSKEEALEVLQRRYENKEIN